MGNLDQCGLIKPFAEAPSNGENDVRHKIEDETWVDNRYVVFDMRESCEQHQKGGAS